MEVSDDVGPGPADKTFMRELGSRGLLGISWPEEYGGLGRPLMDQYIFSEEIGDLRRSLHQRHGRQHGWPDDPERRHRRAASRVDSEDAQR